MCQAEFFSDTWTQKWGQSLMSYSENTAFIAQAVYSHHLKSRTQLKNKGTKEDHLKKYLWFFFHTIEVNGSHVVFDPTYFHYINKNIFSLVPEKKKSKIWHECEQMMIHFHFWVNYTLSLDQHKIRLIKTPSCCMCRCQRVSFRICQKRSQMI